MDSFEWKAGYTEKFGLYHVDFNSKNKTRTAKMSAKVFSKIAQTNRIHYSYRPLVEERFTSSSSEEIFDGFKIFFLSLFAVMIVLLSCFILFNCIKKMSA